MSEHTERNDETRQRLKSLLESITDDILRREIGHGWTVSAGLAHLAYWDRTTVIRLRARRAGKEYVWVPDVLDDVLNDAALPQWRALDPRDVARDVIAVAEELDREIASLPAVIVAEARERYPRAIDRSAHRLEHIADIEAVLGS